MYGSPKFSAGVLEKSLELELFVSLVLVSQSSAYAAHHVYSMSPYAYLSSDYVTSIALFSHHIWVSAFSMLGAFVHGGIFACRDYGLGGQGDSFGRILSHKASVVSHLSWVSLWLGFHTLLVYIHNDSVSAFGGSEKQLSISPLYAQLIQEFSGKKSYGIMDYYGSFSGLSFSFLPISSPDSMAHHAISLGLHVTVLVLTKGAHSFTPVVSDTWGFSFIQSRCSQYSTGAVYRLNPLFGGAYTYLRSLHYSIYFLKLDNE